MAGGYRPEPKDGFEKLVKMIADLQRQVDVLKTAASNRNASVSDGGDFVILDSSGNQVVKLGHDSAGRRGASLTGPTGVDLLDFFVSTSTGLGTLALNDQSGATTFATDNDGAGTGIFWPLVPIAFGAVDNTANWPSNSSGTFATVLQAGSEHFSQGLFVACRVVCLGGATAGQARLLCDGVQVGSTASVTTSVGEADFRGLAGGTIRTDAFLEIQTRVTAGAGTCRAQVYQACWNPYALSV